MTQPSLENVFEYLSLLIAEHTESGEPFVLGKIQPAITFKFPTFKLANYGLNGMKDFLEAGERANYFILVNTGDVKTAYLTPGTKRRVTSVVPNVAQMTADDPRRTRWMTELLEELLKAERADQLLRAIANSASPEVLTPSFDAFLAGQERTMQYYYVRGKVRRIRQFIAALVKQGETHAVTVWQPTRSPLRFPAVPTIGDSPRAAQAINSVFQGESPLRNLPLEVMNNTFFAVIRFYREKLSRDRAWDWVAGLDLLEEEAHSIPRPEPQQKKGILGMKQLQPQVEPLDETQIAGITRKLLRAAGIGATMDETPIWQGYLAAESLDAGLRYLTEHPNLPNNTKFLTWLDGEIARLVEANEMNAVRALANKSALVLLAQKYGPEGARTHSNELRPIYEAVLSGAELLAKVLTFLKIEHTHAALAFLRADESFVQDESVGVLLDEQMVRAARDGNVPRFRRARERMDLWTKVSELGLDQGAAQHARFAAIARTDDQILIEMGVLLLPRAENADEKREIIERFPVVVSQEGLNMLQNMLDVLSFRQADDETYTRYYDAKRIVERCIQLGIDRALVELK
ncbi:MAG: hypothetical protein OHK0023_24670 [Anaerolineae bacterium]